jgi:phage terminase small subunit
MTARPRDKNGIQILTPKEEAFCLKYVELNDGCAAYRKAYDASAANNNIVARNAKRLLKKPHIVARLEALRARVVERHDITLDRIVTELSRVAFLDVRKIFDSEGNLKKPQDLDDETAAAVAGLEVEELWEGRGDDRERVGSLHKVKLSDKVRALEIFLRYLGQLKDKLEVTQSREQRGDACRPDGGDCYCCTGFFRLRLVGLMRPIDDSINWRPH